MLWDASAINGYAIEASDGRLGTVSDLLFEDVGWVIRWLVVDTGNWLPGRKVLLPLSALGHPDRALRHFPIKLTMQQVKDSPDVDTDQPVSRQIEAHVYDYFGCDPYWKVAASSRLATPWRRHSSRRSTSRSLPCMTWLAPMLSPMRVTRISEALQLSPDAISTPATARSVMSRTSSWTCWLEHPLHQGRHQELVARREAADLAVLGASDRLARQAGARQCQPSEGQKRSALRSVNNCRRSL